MLATATLYVGAFLAVLAVVVAIHEWGHYAAGRLLGLKIDAFSIGMGPTLLSRTDSRGCEWRVALLPIGGYVRFHGDADGGGGAPVGNLASLSVDPRKIYQLRSPLSRAFVLIAGPAMNVFLGLAILSSLYAANGRPYTPAVVGEVVPGSPAERAGLLAGDLIVSIDGSPMDSFEKVYETVALRPNTEMVFGLSRQGALSEVRARTDSATVTAMGSSQTVGRLGIQSTGAPEIQDIGVLASVGYAASDVYKMSTSMFVAIGQIVTGKRSIDDLGGPVKIAEMSGKAAEIGPQTLVFFVALISVNIGVVNLLPLGILDGGQLLMCAVEAVRRRRFSAVALTRYNTASVVFLVTIMLVLTANDIGGLFARFAG